LLIGLGDSHDLDFGVVERVVEKSVDVTVNQTHDADSERRGAGCH
jgi:hypothetical protein